jgi:AAA+ superfamily predicted ATPase
LLVDAADGLESESGIARRMLLAEREALLSGAVLCWSEVDNVLHATAGQESNSRLFVRGLASGSVPTVLLSERAWEPGRLLGQRPFLRLELADASYDDRQACWTAGLKGSSAVQPQDVAALAGRFRLSPGQIDDAILRARSLAWSRDPSDGRVSLDDVDAACRVQAQHRLGTLARKLVPRYTWDDIVLPSAQLTTLRLIATMIRQRPTVYGQWGFDRKLAMGKGVMALFAGPSGTGKTMAAEILAHDLGLDLYRIDLSSVVNKYIGETEKNLERLFSEAQESDAILFFDEADALFGKRSGVSDAHDRYANIETAYLLQRTEEYNGLVILASNLPRNMDDAFVRRIHFTVTFPPPDEAERLELWMRTFPNEAPRGHDLDLEFLARQLKVTGGNIRNIILASAFLAADEQQPISMRHLVRASAYEFQKMGKMLLESDFGHYMEMAR